MTKHRAKAESFQHFLLHSTQERMISMATNWGYENGGVVPTDGQIMAATHEGRQAIQEHGTPELIASLAALRAWTFEQVADQESRRMRRGSSRTPITAPPGRSPWPRSNGLFSGTNSGKSTKPRSFNWPGIGMKWIWP